MATFALYVATLAPDLTWANHGADGGDLITAAWTLGVPHPTGYPVYVLLGRLWATLPLGNVAYRLNLFSALLATGAVVVVARTVLHLLRAEGLGLRLAVTAIVSLTMAAGRTLWSQAVIAEVYAAAAFWVAVCLYLAVREDLATRARYWPALGAALGLGLGTHLTVLLTAPALLVLLWPRLSPRRMAWLGLGLAVGLLPYAYLPLAARRNPPVNWGAAHTWEGFWWLVSGRLYQGYAFGLPWRELPGRLSAWAALWASQWSWAGLFLMLAGWQLLWAARRRLAVAVMVLFGSFTVYAIGYHTADSFVYLIPAFLSLNLPMAWGAAALWRRCRSAGKWRAIALCGGAVLLLAVPAWSVAASLPAVAATGSRAARVWLEEVARRVPVDALVVSGDDRHTFALSYLQWVEGRRQDLLVIDGELWQQAWYAEQVRPRRPELHALGEGAPLEALLALGREGWVVILTTPRENVPLEPLGSLWLVSSPP